MKTVNELERSAALLLMPIEELFSEAKKAVEIRDMNKLWDIGILVKRFFCKKIAKFEIERLSKFNELLVRFIAWFEWEGVPKWEQAVSIIDKFKTIVELSQQISETESTEKAYKFLKKSSYGLQLVELLYEKKFMKPGEIKESLNIKSMQQVSNILSAFEKYGIVVREIDGKNVWVSLGFPGMAIYKEYFKTDAPYMRKVIDVLRNFDQKNFEKAEQTLQQLKENEPDNPIVFCILGIITMEKGDLPEAGRLLTKAVKLGVDQIDKRRIFLFLYILEHMNRLDPLKDGIMMINMQRDDISEQIKPTLRLLGMYYDYLGNTPRAIEYKRLAA